MADERIPVVILCGGPGTRLAEQTEVRPKPLVEIGGRPILWHIMKHYSRYGFNEFVLALGHKGDQIKRYFLDYHAVGQDMTISLQDGQRRAAATTRMEPWKVHLVDTGEATLTGGRLRQLQPLIGDGTFMLTYGDGVGNVPTRRAAGVSSLARRARDADRGASAGPIRRAGVRRRPDPPLQGEVHAARGLDQRRLLHRRAGGAEVHRDPT